MMECSHGASAAETLDQSQRLRYAQACAAITNGIEDELAKGKRRLTTGNRVATKFMDQHADLVNATMVSLLVSIGAKRLLRRQQQKQEKEDNKGETSSHIKNMQPKEHVDFPCTLTQVIVQLENKVFGSTCFDSDIKSESELVNFFQSRLPCKCLDRYSKELKEKDAKRRSRMDKSKSLSAIVVVEKSTHKEKVGASDKSVMTTTSGGRNQPRAESRRRAAPSRSKSTSEEFMRTMQNDVRHKTPSRSHTSSSAFAELGKNEPKKELVDAVPSKKSNESGEDRTRRPPSRSKSASLSMEVTGVQKESRKELPDPNQMARSRSCSRPRTPSRAKSFSSSKSTGAEKLRSKSPLTPSARQQSTARAPNGPESRPQSSGRSKSNSLRDLADTSQKSKSTGKTKSPLPAQSASDLGRKVPSRSKSDSFPFKIVNEGRQKAEETWEALTKKTAASDRTRSRSPKSLRAKSNPRRRAPPRSKSFEVFNVAQQLIKTKQEDFPILSTAASPTTKKTPSVSSPARTHGTGTPTRRRIDMRPKTPSRSKLSSFLEPLDSQRQRDARSRSRSRPRTSTPVRVNDISQNEREKADYRSRSRSKPRSDTVATSKPHSKSPLPSERENCIASTNNLISKIEKRKPTPPRQTRENSRSGGSSHSRARGRSKTPSRTVREKEEEKTALTTANRTTRKEPNPKSHRDDGDSIVNPKNSLEKFFHNDNNSEIEAPLSVPQAAATTENNNENKASGPEGNVEAPTHCLDTENVDTAQGEENQVHNGLTTCSKISAADNTTQSTSKSKSMGVVTEHLFGKEMAQNLFDKPPQALADHEFIEETKLATSDEINDLKDLRTEKEEESPEESAPEKTRPAKITALHVPRHMNRMTECSARDCGIYRPLFKFTACAGCQSAFYCNVTCQRKDWKFHSSECAMIAAKKSLQQGK